MSESLPPNPPDSNVPLTPEQVDLKAQSWKLDNEAQKEKDARDLLHRTIGAFTIGIVIGIVGLIGVLTHALWIYHGSSSPSVLSDVHKVALAVFGGFVGFSSFLVFWLVMFRLTSLTGVHDADGHSRTSKTIAFYVMAAFVLGLVGIFVAGQVAPSYGEKIPESARTWLDMFRNGFVLLGTALTTIIGFYFGSKQGEQAQKQLAQVSKDLHNAQALLLKNRDSSS